MITAQITGDAAVITRLRTLAGGVATKLRTAIQRETFALVGVVKRDYLSGQPLKRRTGRLSRSVNGRVEESPTQIAGRVGTNVRYAAAHECGFDGVVNVREHLRTVREAYGRPIAPVQATVRAHARHVHLPQRSFLRAALRAREGAIREALHVAVAEATA